MSFFVSESIENIIDLNSTDIKDEEIQESEKAEYSAYLSCILPDKEVVRIPFSAIERKTKSLFVVELTTNLTILQNIFFNKVVFSKIIIGSDSLDVNECVFLRAKEVSKSFNVFLEIILEEAPNV